MNYVKTKITVPKRGAVNHYINLPVIMDEKPIGVITEAIEFENEYELTLVIFKKKVAFEFLDGEPNALVILKEQSLDDYQNQWT